MLSQKVFSEIFLIYLIHGISSSLTVEIFKMSFFVNSTFLWGEYIFYFSCFFLPFKNFHGILLSLTNILNHRISANHFFCFCFFATSSSTEIFWCYFFRLSGRLLLLLLKCVHHAFWRINFPTASLSWQMLLS